MAFPFQAGLRTERPRPRKGKQRARIPWLRFLPRSVKLARHNSGRKLLAFESLEPRLLLNADVLAVNLAHDIGAPPIDHSVIVQLVHETEKVNSQTVTLQRVQVVDQNDGAVLAFGDLGEISAVSITGGAGKDTLTIDATSFAGYSVPKISFDGGGGGQNAIVFDNTTDTNWSLTGADKGAVSGGGADLSFQNVADLTGAANNNDTLTVEPGGSLSGVFDGGAGGSNSLVFDNGPHQAAGFSVGPQYNTVTLDGQSFNYARVESTNIGDPSSANLSAGLNAEVSQSGSTDFILRR